MSANALIAGWHPDPIGRGEYRYHDGQAWTSSVATGGTQSLDTEGAVILNRPVGAAPPKRPRVPIQSGLFAWAIASAALIVIGSLGPWVVVGPFSVGGTANGKDGGITLVLGIIAGISLFIGRPFWLPSVFAALVLVTTAIDIADISNTSNGLFSASPGWGILLTAVAAISLCVWPFVAKNAMRVPAHDGLPAAPIAPPS